MQSAAHSTRAGVRGTRRKTGTADATASALVSVKLSLKVKRNGLIPADARSRMTVIMCPLRRLSDMRVPAECRGCAQMTGGCRSRLLHPAPCCERLPALNLQEAFWDACSMSSLPARRSLRQAPSPRTIVRPTVGGTTGLIPWQCRGCGCTPTACRRCGRFFSCWRTAEPGWRAQRVGGQLRQQCT